MKDAEFVAEAKKDNFELDPVADEDLEKVVNGFFKADPATVNRLRELLKQSRIGASVGQAVG